MRGEPSARPSRGWKEALRRRSTIAVDIGDWVSGVYAAKLTTDDGRVGFAPLILRPAVLGTCARQS